MSTLLGRRKAKILGGPSPPFVDFCLLWEVVPFPSLSLLIKVPAQTNAEKALLCMILVIATIMLVLTTSGFAGHPGDQQIAFCTLNLVRFPD